MALKKLPLDEPGNHLTPGLHKIKVKCTPEMEPVAKKLAASLTVWNIAIAAAEALAPLQGMKVKFPRTNFVDPKTGKDKVGGSYRPRKGYDEKSKTFWFWMAVI